VKTCKHSLYKQNVTRRCPVHANLPPGGKKNILKLELLSYKKFKELKETTLFPFVTWAKQQHKNKQTEFAVLERKRAVLYP